MLTTIKKRWRNAEKLLCPCLRFEKNPDAYNEGEPTGKWLTLVRNPCKNCDYSSCANFQKTFDEPERLFFLGEERWKEQTMSQIKIDSEDVVKIRKALYWIQINAQQVPGLCMSKDRLKMTENVIEQVKRIDKLLPVVKFEGGK